MIFPAQDHAGHRWNGFPNALRGSSNCSLQLKCLAQQKEPSALSCSREGPVNSVFREMGELPRVRAKWLKRVLLSRRVGPKGVTQDLGTMADGDLETEMCNTGSLEFIAFGRAFQILPFVRRLPAQTIIVKQ